jgi:hypothetical protein
MISYSPSGEAGESEQSEYPAGQIGARFGRDENTLGCRRREARSLWLLIKMLRSRCCLPARRVQALFALKKATEKCGVPSNTLGPVEVRASQING